MNIRQSLVVLFIGATAYGTANAQQLPKIACGSIKRLEKFDSKFVEPRNVDIWFPEGYSSNKKYPVLYMHDGQALYDSTLIWSKMEWRVDETMCKLLAEKKIKDCIVVGIWNTTKRHPEYCPQKPFYSMSAAGQQKLLAYKRQNSSPVMASAPVSDAYLKFLVTELKPYVDSHYSTLDDRKNTFIAGSSMGGLISIYAICEYPQVFGAAACLSTHWPVIYTAADNPFPEAMLQYLKTHLPSPKSHKIYFDYGSKTLDTLYKPFQLQADDIIRKGGYGTNNWMTREFTGADHSEKSWSQRFGIPVTFLLKK